MVHLESPEDLSCTTGNSRMDWGLFEYIYLPLKKYSIHESTYALPLEIIGDLVPFIPDIFNLRCLFEARCLWDYMQ